MGQAKDRGTYQERFTAAIQRQQTRLPAGELQTGYRPAPPNLTPFRGRHMLLLAAAALAHSLPGSRSGF